MWPFSILRQRREAHEAAIVAALGASGEMTGYMIGKATGIRVGSLYSALMSLEAAGRIVSRWGVATAERGWRRPRIYSLNVSR